MAGKKPLLEKIKAEIENNPLTYSEFEIKNKQQEKWLGEQLREGCNSDSVMATIKERKGKATASIFEIKAVCCSKVNPETNLELGHKDSRNGSTY